MPKFRSDDQTLRRMERGLLDSYANDQREFDPEAVHVSDLVSCLRRPVLSQDYDSDWSLQTLYLFTLGRAWEKAVFTALLPEETQELEVLEDGIIGHIDFGTDDLDYECKATFKREPKSQDEIDDLFEGSEYWVEQAAAYAIMRRRRAHRFAILHIPSFPNPTLRVYEIEWTAEEQARIWESLKQRREYVVKRRAEGLYPMKTLDTKLCQSCQVRTACDMVEEQIRN